MLSICGRKAERFVLKRLSPCSSDVIVDFPMNKRKGVSLMPKREDEFRGTLKKRLKESLKALLKKRKLQIKSPAKILYDTTFARKKDGYSPQLGFLEQDIAIYSEERIPKEISKYFYMSDTKEFIRIPRLISILSMRSIHIHFLLIQKSPRRLKPYSFFQDIIWLFVIPARNLICC